MTKETSNIKKETITACDDLIVNDTESRIRTIRGEQVILDFDLAELYGVETRALNQAVMRNLHRFPDDFRFQLTEDEFSILKSQIVTSSWGGNRKIPYAFTEQGVAMLSALLRSVNAVKQNTLLMNSF